MSWFSSLSTNDGGDLASSFGSFLKTASSAIESRIDTVLGTEGGPAAGERPADRRVYFC